MANITDQRVVSWSDQRARTLADAGERFIALLQTYQADYVAQGIGAIITAGGGTNLVGDTAAVAPIDGRQQVTGNTIGPNLKAAVDQAVTALTVTLITGVGVTVKALLDTIQVNGSVR